MFLIIKNKDLKVLFLVIIKMFLIIWKLEMLNKYLGLSFILYRDIIIIMKRLMPY